MRFATFRGIVQLTVILGLLFCLTPFEVIRAARLKAGIAKKDITDTEAGPINDRLYVKALVLEDGSSRAAIITLDAVAIAEIGSIQNDYLASVRFQIQEDLNIPGKNVLINASHCHGAVASDVGQRTVKAVREALQNMVPVEVGAGIGYEDRIMENRRLKLRNGEDADVRHAYSLPPDEEVIAVGPVDPEIGILRLDKTTGGTLAVVYNFACHPIQGVPNGGTTADFPGFASKVIEDNLGEGVMSFFLQGAGGDINPILYKDVTHPRDAEPYGSMLGLSTLQALNAIETMGDVELKLLSETLELPRRTDFAERIGAMEAERERLLRSLQGTSLNLRTFIHLFVQYRMFREFPSYYSHLYLHEQMMGTNSWKRLDAENRKNIEQYIQNIYAMEQLTRIKVNLGLLKKHQANAAGRTTVDVEVQGFKIGNFVLITFPGELSVEIGLNIKASSPHEYTFVAGCTNGYIYYAPTAEQIKAGEAQEDHECILAPGWQEIFEARAADMLKRF